MESYLEAFNKNTIGLTRNFRVNPSSCNNHKHYEDYIKYCAISDNIAGRSATQILVGEDKNGEKILLGFISLRATSLITNDGDCDIGFPAIEIYELAISKDHERNGYGKVLVDYAFSTANELSDRIGIRYIVLCSDSKAEGFYSKMKFGFMRESFILPRDTWNKGCTPMVLQIRE